MLTYGNLARKRPWVVVLQDVQKLGVGGYVVGRKQLTISGATFLYIIIIFERLTANEKLRNFVGKMFSQSFHPFTAVLFVGYVTSPNKYVVIYALRNIKN